MKFWLTLAVSVLLICAPKGSDSSGKKTSQSKHAISIRRVKELLLVSVSNHFVCAGPYRWFSGSRSLLRRCEYIGVFTVCRIHGEDPRVQQGARYSEQDTQDVHGEIAGRAWGVNDEARLWNYRGIIPSKTYGVL